MYCQLAGVKLYKIFQGNFAKKSSKLLIYKLLSMPRNKYFFDEDSLKLRTGVIEIWQSVCSDGIPMRAKLPQSVSFTNIEVRGSLYQEKSYRGTHF